MLDISSLYYSILYFITSVLNLSLGLFVFLKKPKDKIHRYFFLFVLSGVGWIITLYLFYLFKKELLVLWIGRLNFSFAVLLIYFLFRFVKVFPDKTPEKTIINYIFLSETIFLGFITLFTGLIDKAEIIKNNERITVFGPLYFLFIIHFFGYALASVVVSIIKFKKSASIQRWRMIYFYFGFLPAIFIASITNIILPFFFKIYYFQKISVLVTIWAFLLSAYAITRYRLMGIRVAVGRAFAYITAWGLAVAVALGLYFISTLLKQRLPFTLIFPGIILAAVLVYQLSLKRIEALAGKYLYYTFYSYRQVISDLTENLTRILDLEELGEVIVETLVSTMKLEKAVVLMREKNNTYQIVKNIGFREENGISLVRDNFLTKWLEKNKRPLVYEELVLGIKDARDSQERKNLESLKLNMERIEANLCLPLFHRQILNGIIVLGKKISGDPYFKEDMQLLTDLANQTAIALENARLYEKVRDLSQNLQEKVDQQTKELRKALKELQELNETKTEFISMASHQLRTPLTIVNGYVSMILEGGFGKPSAKMRKALENIWKASVRLTKIVGDLLDVSQIELGKVVLKKEPTDLSQLVKECCQQMQKPAKDKGLLLVFHQPKRSFPLIPLDRSKISQVILNLLDNAIRYTNKGRIDVFINPQPNCVLIKIKDTGQGLTQEDKKQIFEGFTRGSAGREEFVEGTGLGLYVAKKFIESHRGRIFAESKGKGRGSTFFVELPFNH